ncbi:MAG: radical SAM protein, partial [Magnetococcales bacterium]|nr:radical SAM protein [Magnetococcales bacterium]
IISTNGWMFTEEIVKECYDLGVDTINVSLDSGIPELHDLFRKKRGSYDKVMKLIEWGEKHGIKMLINHTLHKGNLYTTGFRDLLEFCETRKIMINILFAKGVGEFMSKRCMLDHKDIEAYRQIIKPYAYAHIHHTAGGEGHDDSVNYNYGKGGCPGTSEMFNMTPYGDVIQCANMHIYFGNVRDKPLKDIRDKVLNESPFGQPNNCFLTLEPDFMNVYYPMLESKGKISHAGDTHISLDEFNEGLKQYEIKNKKVVFPNSYQNEEYFQQQGKVDMIAHRKAILQDKH